MSFFEEESYAEKCEIKAAIPEAVRESETSIRLVCTFFRAFPFVSRNSDSSGYFFSAV